MLPFAIDKLNENIHQNLPKNIQDSASTHQNHQSVVRKKADSYSSALPHSLSLSKLTERTNWFTTLSALTTQEKSRRSTDQQDTLGLWKSYKPNDRYYDVWIKQKNGPVPPGGVHYIDAPGDGYVYGSIRERQDEEHNPYRGNRILTDATEITVAGITVDGKQKELVLRASLYDTQTSHPVQYASHSQVLDAGAPQRLRIEVVNQPTDGFYFSWLVICLKDNLNEHKGYDVVILFATGPSSYLPATIDGQLAFGTNYQGTVQYEMATSGPGSIPKTAYLSYTEHQDRYTAALKVTAGHYSYKFIFDYGPDYIWGDQNYYFRVQNLLDGTLTWKESSTFDYYRFWGDGVRFATAGPLPGIQLDIEERIIGAMVKHSYGTMSVGPLRPLGDSTSSNWIGWGKLN